MQKIEELFNYIKSDRTEVLLLCLSELVKYCEDESVYSLFREHWKRMVDLLVGVESVPQTRTIVGKVLVGLTGIQDNSDFRKMFVKDRLVERVMERLKTVVPDDLTSLSELRLEEIDNILCLLNNATTLKHGQQQFCRIIDESELDDEELDCDSDSDDEIEKFENLHYLLELMHKCKIEHPKVTSRILDIFVNITQQEEGRLFFLNAKREKDIHIILNEFLVDSNESVRKSSVGWLRNCLFISEQHELLVNMNIIPLLLDRLSNKNENSEQIRRDEAECIYIISLFEQVVKLAPLVDEIQSIADQILHNTPEKRLLLKAISNVQNRTEKVDVQEGQYVRYDPNTGQMTPIS